MKKIFFLSLFFSFTFFVLNSKEQTFIPQDTAPKKAIIAQHIKNFFDAIIRTIERLLLKKDNFYVIDDERGVYRSRQLSSKKFQYYIDKYNIKTIINLRGENPNEKWYQEELDITQKNDITLINIAISSQYEPTLENFKTLISSFFNQNNYPMLIHCKSGANRTGEAAGLYLLTQKQKIYLL